jgi:hypothetical protein
MNSDWSLASAVIPRSSMHRTLRNVFGWHDKKFSFHNEIGCSVFGGASYLDSLIGGDGFGSGRTEASLRQFQAQKLNFN